MTQPLLSLHAVHAVYAQAIAVLHGVSLEVGQGEIVALLGANGAGKSTTLRAIAGLLPAQRGQVTGGRVFLDGGDVTGARPERIAARGLASVLEGRRCFRSLTIEENLLTGAAARHASRAETRADLDRVYDILPRLRERRRSPAGLASGGEQQMAAIGRALMARPRLLLLDEPSMGLAPKIVDEIFAVLRRLNAEQNLSVLVAEQNAVVALRHAHRGLVLEHGVVVLSDTAPALRRRDDIKDFYLGGSDRRVATASLIPAT